MEMHTPPADSPSLEADLTEFDLQEAIDPKSDYATSQPITADVLRLHQEGWANGAKLLDRIERVLRRFVSLTREDLYQVLSLWIMGTYVYRRFSAYPYIWVTSPQPQAGKSTLLAVISALSYRSSGVLTHETPATTYRDIERTGGTVIQDEFEKASQANKGLMAILNSGYTRGGIVRRVNQATKKVEGFSIYCPKAFAGLAQVPDAFATRCIRVPMLPKPPDSPVQPNFEGVAQVSAETILRLKELLYVWALDNAQACSEACLARDELGMPSGMDDRAADVMAPLYSVARVAGVETADLDQFCVWWAEDRRGVQALSAEPEGEQTEVIQALLLNMWRNMDYGRYGMGVEMIPEKRIPTRTLTDLVMRACPEVWPSPSDDAPKTAQDAFERLVDKETKHIGRLLRSLGFTTKDIRLYRSSATRKGVEFSEAELLDVMKRFNVETPSETSET